MRVLVDLTGLRQGGEGGGIKPALLRVLRWLGEHGAGRLQFVYVANQSTLAEVQDLARPGDAVIMAAEITPDLAARQGCDVVYCPFGFTDCACPGISTITLVVDLLHRDFPSTLPEPDRIYRERKFEAAIEATDRYQVISNFTAGRLQECYQLPAGRMFLTYLPVHDRLAGHDAPAAAAPKVPGLPYFLYPAKFWKHKNHEALIEAYALYRHKTGATAWSLILAGYTDKVRMAHLERLAHSLRVETDVVFMGYVSETKLAELYRTAGALVFPSLYEGFGIPLIEAMAYWKPIIASDAAAIPEIVGRAALLVDSRNPKALAAAMHRVADNAPVRDALVAHGRAQLSRFSAEAEFGRLLEEIERAARTPARWRRSGHYAVDGLTDPVAIFALPQAEGELTLHLRTRPLPVARTMQLFCGRDLLAERIIPANEAAELTVTFRPLAHAVTLRVPDAASLSPTDPRTHGILLDSMRVQTVDGALHNLLASEVPVPPALDLIESTSAQSRPEPAQPFKHLWHIDTPIPAWLPEGHLEIRGWCVGQNGRPANLRLRIDDMVWPFQANQPRPDVRAVHPRLENDACGFTVRLRVRSGRHRLVIEVQESAESSIHLARHRVTVPPLVGLRRWLATSNASLLAFRLMVGPSFAPRPLMKRRLPKPSAGARAWPRFAIVTPSYQQGQFLEQTMRGVLDQDVDCDYVVQDGGSTDGSVDVIARIAKEQAAHSTGSGQAARIAAWASEPDKGQADAIARGFAKTSGRPEDVMAWINSDDYYLPGALAFVADYFARHPEVDVLYGNRILVDEQSREIGRWFLPKHDDAVLCLNDFVPQETMFWRRRIWDKAGPIDPAYSFAMDWDLLLRFQAAGAKIVHLPYFLACFRVHSSQKTLSTIQGVGQAEIDALRLRSNGRVISPAEIENDPRLARYLRRSALIELCWGLGLRVE